MEDMSFHSPLISLSPQSLLDCDSLNFGCLGVIIMIFRANQVKLYDGSFATTSQIPAAIRIELKDIQMVRNVHQKVDARYAGPRIAARLRQIRKYIVLRRWSV